MNFKNLLAKAGADMPPRPESPLRNAPLTTQLKQPDSPMSRFLREYLPNVAPVAANYRAQLADAKTVRPDTNGRYDWAAVGHAVEYRLLTGIGYRPEYEPIPGTGAPKLPGVVRAASYGVGAALRQAEITDNDIWRTVAGLGLGLADQMPEVAGPVPETLTEDEDHLVRVLYVQSWFESLFRSGRLNPALSESFTDAELLARVPDSAVRDVWEVAYASWPVWRAFRGVPQGSVHYNPVMPPSLGIPADGDVVVDGLLVDVKTTIHPNKIGTSEIYQLAGYLMMDTQDRYGMNACGLAMSRQGVMVQWDVDQFLGLLSNGRYGVGSLPALRESLSSYLEGESVLGYEGEANPHNQADR
jgi:hypothetical protein